MDEDILLAAAHQEYKAGNCKLALQHCLLVHDKSPRRTDALLLLGAIYYQVDLSAILVSSHSKGRSGQIVNLRSRVSGYLACRRIVDKVIYECT